MSRQKYVVACPEQEELSLAHSVDQIVIWMCQDVLPLWISEGIDHQLFTAYFSIELSSHSSNRKPKANSDSGWFGLSQAQLVYVLSQAQHLHWLSDNQDTLVKRMIEFSGRHGVLPCRSDGFVSQLTCDLGIANPDRTLLDHAYFMMASTASFVAYDVGNDLRRAYNIMHWLDIKMTHPEGGWCDRYDGDEQASSESYLRCLQTFLFLFEVTRKSVWLDRAGVVYDLFVERIFDPETFLVYKQLIRRGSTPDDPNEVASPCQLFFWVWLLRRYQNHIGDMAGDLIEEICNQIYNKGKDFIAQTAPSHSSLLLSSFVLASSYQVQLGAHSDEKDFHYAVGLLRKYAIFSPIKGWCSDKPPANEFTSTRLFYLFEAVREAHLFLNPEQREVPLKEVGGL